MMDVAAATGDFEDCTPGCTPGKCKVGSEHFLDLHYLLLTKCRENCKELGDCYICSEKIKNQEEKLTKQKEFLSKLINKSLTEIGDWFCYFHSNILKSEKSNQPLVEMLRDLGLFEAIYLTFGSTPRTAVIGASLLKLIAEKYKDLHLLELHSESKLFWAQCIQVFENQSSRLLQRISVSHCVMQVLCCQHAVKKCPLQLSEFSILMGGVIDTVKRSLTDELFKEIGLFPDFTMLVRVHSPNTLIIDTLEIVSWTISKYTFVFYQRQEWAAVLFPFVKDFCVLALKKKHWMKFDRASMENVMKMLLVFTKPLSKHLYSSPSAISYLPHHETYLNQLCQDGFEDLLISFLTMGIPYFYATPRPKTSFSCNDKVLLTFTLQVLANYFKRKKLSKGKVAIVHECLAKKIFEELIVKDEYDEPYAGHLGPSYIPDPKEALLLGEEVAGICGSPRVNWFILLMITEPFCCTSPQCKNPSNISTRKQELLIDQAVRKKQLGNFMMKEEEADGKKWAYWLYTEAIELSSICITVADAELHLYYSNRAQAAMSLKRWYHAKEDLAKAFSLDSKYVRTIQRMKIVNEELAKLKLEENKKET